MSANHLGGCLVVFQIQVFHEFNFYFVITKISHNNRMNTDKSER